MTGIYSVAGHKVDTPAISPVLMLNSDTVHKLEDRCCCGTQRRELL